MSLTSQDLHQRLTQHLHPELLQVLDESAAHAGHAGSNGQTRGTHFRVQIWSEQFHHQSRVKCHRLVYDALQDCMAMGLHALAIEIKQPSAKDNL
jgi:BolA family transcriptional regulator, general stress-responsive regulator